MSLVAVKFAPDLFIGGTAMFIPAAVIMVAEWFSWHRKNTLTLTVLSIIYILLACLVVAAGALLVFEAAQKGWHISHAFGLPGFGVVAIYLLTCSIFRLRIRRRPGFSPERND